MILKSLEMHGFKSFADKTVFDFEKGITAIVGPNGSGKSNISDAIRWVLGEQSSKSLRGSKMEDVVFSGTGKRRAMGYAEVTLKLDNMDRGLKKYDKDEVAVTRRYYRSGESEYSINGETARLRDIHEMFMDTGLGRDGYSMVGQGKIDQMISTKGSDRREMFEEASGISHYRYSRNDSMKKLSQAEENMVRLRDILTELEARIEPLRVQSEKAQKFLVLAQEKKELEIGLWLCTIQKAKEELKRQEDKLAVALCQYEQSEKELAEIEEKIDQAIKEAQKITEQIEEIRLNISSFEEKALSVDSQIAVLENTIEHNNSTIERISREKDESISFKDITEKEIKRNEDEIKELTDFSEERQKELASMSRSLTEAQEKTGSIESETAVYSQRLALLTKQEAEKRVEVQASLTTKEEIESRLCSVDELIAQRSTRLEEIRQSEKAATDKLSKINGDIASCTNSLSGYKIRLNSRQTKEHELKKEIDGIAFDIQKKESRAKMLDELEKNMEGYQGSVKAVMKQKEEGRLSGIHGTVSRLISVKDEYAVAIETAFGAAVQNIVTDSETDAKRAIEFLKRSGGGRATFLPMTSIKGKRLSESGLTDCYGFVDLAVNLLTYDKKYEDIISSLLGRVAVCEDMESAIAIGKRYSNRFKIVTLDGQVINPGGSMTGGSKIQNAGLLSRGTQKEELKKQVAELNERLDTLKGTYKLLHGEIASLTADTDSLNADILNLQESRIRLEGERKLYLEQIASEESEINKLIFEKEHSGERIAGLTEKIQQANEIISDYFRKISEIETTLENLGTQKQYIAEQKNAISEEAAKINLAYHTAQRDIEAKKTAIRELAERLEAQGDKQVRLEEEIQNIKGENGRLYEEISTLKTQASELRTKKDNAKNEIALLQEKRNEQESLSTKLRLIERNKTGEREKIGLEVARLEERKVSQMKQYDETVNKLYDEYNLTRREAEQMGIVISDSVKSQRRLNELKSQIRGLGSVNVGAVEEYKEVSERYEFMSGQIEDIEKSKRELIKLIDDLTQKMAARFKEQFYKINEAFGVSFTDLFSGGSAELILDDPSDVLECNIEIKVQPPGKNVQNIDLLSGGEKALSAIALLIAIIKVNPSPFCIFDEVEAALDEVNVSKYAQYLRRMTENTQFILITHRRGSMEEADMLYGVTMQEEGVSKLLELKTAQMAKELGIS